VLEEECSGMLKKFFAELRERNKSDKDKADKEENKI
jgi:hypothetical protein